MADRFTPAVRISLTQRRILANARHGRHLDAGRAPGMSAAGGWDSSIRSCRRRGWLDGQDRLTEAGAQVLGS